MAKCSRKGWSSDFHINNCSRDQLDRFMERQREDLYGRRDMITKVGRSIHSHPMFGEAVRDFTSEEVFQTMLTAAKGGDVQRQFLVGLEFAKRGEVNSAMFWLKKAASVNWPGAKEACARLVRQGDVKGCSRRNVLDWKETKICPKCGKRRLNRDFIYCPMCGLRLPQKADVL